METEATTKVGNAIQEAIVQHLASILTPTTIPNKMQTPQTLAA
jgi:hypothetical protein